MYLQLFALAIKYTFFIINPYVIHSFYFCAISKC